MSPNKSLNSDLDRPLLAAVSTGSGHMDMLDELGFLTSSFKHIIKFWPCFCDPGLS